MDEGPIEVYDNGREQAASQDDSVSVNPTFRVGVAAVIAACALAGCTRHEPTFPEPSARLIDGAFASIPGTFPIGDTEFPADYGTLTVLENRSRVDSGFIHLPVIRIRSRSDDPLEPVFYFGGGPGQSNLQHVGSRWYLLPRHDLVVVGFRGVDGTSVLDCPGVAEAMKGTGSLFGEESMNLIESAWRGCARS